MIIHSTTLDTMEKVITIYGGTKWEKIEGRFLLGANNLYPIGSTGGEATHTLTVNEMPPHRHVTQGYHTLAPSSLGVDNNRVAQANSFISGDPLNTDPNMHLAGLGQAHNNMPPYKAVYIWERIE
jgi:microcystin-dependent protein